MMRNKILLLILLVSFIIGVSSLQRGHDWGDDFAWYILQAKSILNGTTHEFIEQSIFTNTQSTTHVGPLAYPWGYPLILTPAYAIKGINPLALKLPGLFFYIGFLICLYFLMTSRFTRTESLLIVSLFAFNPMLILFLNQILSDIPFLFFSTLTLLWMTQKKERGTIQYVLIGISIFLTTFMRATGVLLLGVFLIIEFFRLVNNRKDRKIVLHIILGSFTVCLAFAIPWIINSLLLPGGGESYLSQYATISIDIVKRFIVSYFNVFSSFFGEGNGWRYLYYVLFAFTLLGAWEKRKEETIFILFSIIWLIVHITYPYWQGPRYIFPLLPIFIYFTFWGMKTAITKLPGRYHRTGQLVFYGFWLLMACTFLFNSSVNAYTNLKGNRDVDGPFDSYSMEMYKYIKEKTPPESVIVFFKPRIIILETGHNTIMSTECDRILRGDFLVLNRKVGENQQIPPERIDSCNLPLNIVLKNRRFIVYEVLK